MAIAINAMDQENAPGVMVVVQKDVWIVKDPAKKEL